MKKKEKKTNDDLSDVFFNKKKIAELQFPILFGSRILQNQKRKREVLITSKKKHQFTKQEMKERKGNTLRIEGLKTV